jgi:hopene-associated glycosyltransferase HpnB
MALQIAAALSLAIWLYLVLGRGGFWRMRDSTLPTTLPSPLPRVAIVIPARNESEVIGRAVASLAAQDYPGAFYIIVVDDHSTDGTTAAARGVPAPNLTVIPAEPLEPGWTGKLWAVHQGVREALRVSPDYLLLTDADIVHPHDNLSALVAQAAAGNYDLVSLMATLHCRTFAERALIPAFVFFFFLLYPPAWIRSPRHRTAGAAGGCMLIRREKLAGLGGIERIRGELIDDCALAREVKRRGGAVWLGLSARTGSIREYGTFAEIGEMISRTAFTQLRHSWWFLLATVAGLVLTYLVPVAAALSGNALGGGAWIAMCIAYVPILRFYGRSPFWAPALPAVALFYLAATVHSAIAHGRGSGGMWKGRAQAARR